MQLTPHPVERKPGVLLRLEAAVHIELGFRARGEERDQSRHDCREDREDDEELDQGVAAFAAESPEPLPDHFACAST